jgi:hypothetical protein
MIDRDRVMNSIYCKNKKEIDDAISGIQDAKKDLRPKGTSKDKSKKRVGSIPAAIYYNMMRLYGQDCWQDDKFVFWFLKAYPQFKLVDKL